MNIRIRKEQNRNTLICTREDGSYTVANLGPSLPHHDLAHFVMENFLQLNEGFFGNLERGCSIQQLSDKDFIKTLGWQTWLAEISARALQALASGSCALNEFSGLINSELSVMGITKKVNISQSTALSLRQKLLELNQNFENLVEGESLELIFQAKEFNEESRTYISS